MALNIPNLGSISEAFSGGFDRGNALISKVMGNILQRQRDAESRKRFDEEMALRKAQFERSGANSDLQRSILQQQLQGLKNKNDPMYEINQFKALQDMIMGGGMPNQNAQNPTQEMGMFRPEGLAEAQQPNSAGSQGMNFDAMRNNPLLRGFFKQKFGFDPLAPASLTQEQKDQHALDLFQKKEDIKKQNKGGDVPTNAVLTQNQQAVQGVDTVLPMLDELINSKNIPGITDFSPGKKAAYNAKTSSMIDTLVAAQSLPKVQASIDLVEEQIRRKTGETVSDYKERLRDLKKDLIKRRARSKDVLSNRKVNTSSSNDFSSMSDEELQRIAGGG